MVLQFKSFVGGIFQRVMTFSVFWAEHIIMCVNRSFSFFENCHPSCSRSVSSLEAGDELQGGFLSVQMQSAKAIHNGKWMYELSKVAFVLHHVSQ